MRALLRKSKVESVILAVKCLETAINVPLELRNEVEGALERVLPPSTMLGFIPFSEIGLTVAPILARGLQSYEPSEILATLLFLSALHYEPVVPIVVRLASDTRSGSIQLVEGFKPVEGKIGRASIIALRNMAEKSDSAKRGLLSILPTLSESFLRRLKLRELYGDDFKIPGPDKRSSTPAKNTVSKPRNTLRPASRYR
jgi:hypothetical protein